MSSITVTHSPNYVPAYGIPIKFDNVQGNKKRNRQRKVSHSSLGASSTDKLAPKSVRMDKEAFHAAIAKAEAQRVVENPQVLTTEDLKYGSYGQNKVREATSTVHVAPLATPLTMSFSSVAKAATTPLPLDFKSRSPSPSSRSASSNSIVDFPALAASSAPTAKRTHIANKAPITITNIKATSTTTKTNSENSSSWNTVARKNTNPTKSMHVPVNQNVWAPKPALITSAGTQATNNIFQTLSDPVVGIPEKKQVTQIDSSFSGPEVTISVTENSPKVNHTWVEVSSKKESTKTDKKSHASNVPAKPLNNQFETLLSEPKSKAPKAPVSKKREQTITPVEKPAASRSTLGNSSGNSSGSSSSKKKTRAERKKGKKLRSEKARAAQDSALPATETKSTAYRLSSDNLSEVTVLLWPIKAMTSSKQKTKPISESKPVASSPSEPIEVKDSNIASPPLADAVTPEFVESKDMKAAEILSTLPVENDILIVIEVSNEIDAPSSLTDPKEDTKQTLEPTPLTQEAFVHSTLESRMLLCHGSDVFDEKLEVIQIEQCYDYTTMESRFDLQHGSDDFDEEIEVAARTEESHNYPTMESRFALQYGSDDFDDETEVVLSIEEPHDYNTTESCFHLQHSPDYFDEEIEVAVPVEESYDDPTMESRLLLQHGSDDSDEGLDEVEKNIVATENHEDSPHPSPQAKQVPLHNPSTIFLGPISLSTFTSQLTSHTRSPTPSFTPAQITTLFASFAAFERMYHSTAQIPGAPTAQEILASATLQQQIKLGRTKLGDFLGRIRFEDGVVGLRGVVGAFEMAAGEEVEKELRIGGRKRVVGRWL